MNDVRTTLRIPGCRMSANASLRDRTTFRVAANAALLVEADSIDALPELFEFARDRYDDQVLVLGGGSNLLLTRDWPGMVVSIGARGATVVEHGETALVRCAGGETWNDFVHWSLAQGFVGLENLALIPGRVGAAPIQNIGAYGTEVKEFIHAVHAFDRRAARSIHLDAMTCAFGYRDSLFKREPGRYLITGVDFLLPRHRELRLDYAGVREELAAMNVTVPDATAVAAAIVRVRQRKLPDPTVVGNAGSFFKNPTVTVQQAEGLRTQHPQIAAWPAFEGGMKLSAAWLIEACGFKGLREGDAGVSSQHALVLVNYGNATGMQILSLARRIQDQVATTFDVRLETEPLII